MLLVIRVRGRALLPVLLLAALVAAPSAAADLADEQALAERYAPIVRLVEQQDVCSYGEPFIPTDIDLLLDEETVALRGPWNVTDLVKIAPTADDLVKRFEYHLDFPGQCAQSRLRLQPLGEAPDSRQQAGRVRARRRRGRLPRRAGAPVLVLLSLQRLQQHTRGRLGDDPAPVRRARRTCGARDGAGRGGVQLARGSRTRRLGRREARARGRPAGRVSGRRFPRQQVRRRAVAGQLRRGGGGLRRHARPAPGGLPSCRDDPERPVCRRGGLSLDRVRGTVGRAPEGLLQRPDRPEPEDAMDAADHLVGGLARPELRRADGWSLRHGLDRLLLHRRRQGLEGVVSASQQSAFRSSSSSRPSSVS